ncbi:hypothetical protein [Actinoplanes sp. URMC 104]|uniref:hypothetical protein n=1 Tax=Actinoplanes sp. URMC 104 TaxID=3423409 RepID=UPI003F19F339
MAANGDEAQQSVSDRVVADFGDGYEVEAIAARYGLTVDEVFAVVRLELGGAQASGPGLPAAPVWPPPAYAPPAADPYSPPAAGPYAPPGPYPAPPAYAPAAPEYYAPPPAYGASGWEDEVTDDDVIVAEYGEGYDVEAIARKHGIGVERVYEVVRRVLGEG